MGLSEGMKLLSYSLTIVFLRGINRVDYDSVLSQ